jgi:L-alanine-DL-glutamate epimerase-like enolase superfamily enzyme
MAHDCTGPCALMANVHFPTNIPNAFMVEFVRAYYKCDTMEEQF